MDAETGVCVVTHELFSSPVLNGIFLLLSLDVMTPHKTHNTTIPKTPGIFALVRLAFQQSFLSCIDVLAYLPLETNITNAHMGNACIAID